MTQRRTIKGQDHWLYVGRITHDPNTGRPILEVLQDDDEVLVQDGSAFVTFWAAQELPRITPEWPSTEPSAEAVELAVRVANEGDVEALARANRIVRALQQQGLDPDDRRVRLAVVATLETLATEIESEGDDHGE